MSYFSSALPFQSRRTASAIPRLTGLGTARPYREVQYPSSSPGSSARSSTESTTCLLDGPSTAPASSRAFTYSAAPTSDAVRICPSRRSQRSSPAVHSGSSTASERTSVA